MIGSETDVKEKKKAYDAAYHAANRGKRKMRQAAYHAANREELLAKQRAYYIANRGTINARTAANYAANSEKVRAARRVRKYGLSPGAYQLMLLQQRNACVICEEIFSKEPHVDHCHRTGEVRGLLCDQCNVGLGNFKDSLKILERAKEYLQGKI